MRNLIKFITFKFRSWFSFSKRQLFVGATLILTAEMVATQLFSGSIRLDLLLLLVISTYIISALALGFDLTGWEFLTLLILPAFYTAAVFLFYYLLPTRWITRLPILGLYALGMYAILLTENIFNVAAERNIQLLRAAHSVGLVISLVTVFFLVETILSLHLLFYINILIVGLIIFPLSIQALWSMELTENITPAVWWGSLIITVTISQLVFVFSFWPIKPTLEGLLITTTYYSLTGMIQQYLIGRLFPRTSREFLGVLIIVFAMALLVVRWGEGIL